MATQRIKITSRMPINAPDKDWTLECLEAGSTFRLDGVGFATGPIPITSAVIKDGIITTSGYAFVDLEPNE